VAPLYVRLLPVFEGLWESQARTPSIHPANRCGCCRFERGTPHVQAAPIDADALPAGLD